jgi:AcrR family transcriptional regulator
MTRARSTVIRTQRSLAVSGRRRASAEPQQESSRKRIQSSALKLFGRYGYDGVSLQMIADDVGLHKSSLFHHYAGKLQLMDEAAEAIVAELLALLAPLLAEEEPSLSTLYAAIPKLVDYFSERPEAARLLVAIMSSPNDSELRRLASSERSLAFYAGLSRWLERARKAAVIRPLSIRQAIPNLMGLLLFYPAVADDLRDLVGANAFSSRARQVRKEELLRLVEAMFAPGARA